VKHPILTLHREERRGHPGFGSIGKETLREPERQRRRRCLALQRLTWVAAISQKGRAG